jgi:hypothetical protein
MYSDDNMSMSEGSQTHLVKASKKKRGRAHQNVDDMLERALDDSDAETDADSTIAYI